MTDGAQMSAAGPAVRGRSFEHQFVEALVVPPAYVLAYTVGNVPRVAIALDLYFGVEAASRGDVMGVGFAMMGGGFVRRGGALDDVAENMDDVLRGARAAEAKAAMPTATQGTQALRAEAQMVEDVANTAVRSVDDLLRPGGNFIGTVAKEGLNKSLPA